MDCLVSNRRLDVCAVCRIGETTLHLDGCRLDVGPRAERDWNLPGLERVGQRLVTVELSNRFSFDFVCGQNIVGTPPGFDRPELPNQVVGVGHAGVETKTSRWREPVGGVANEEHTTLAITLSDLRTHVPRRRSKHVELDVLADHCSTNEVAASPVGERLDRFVVGIPAMHVDGLAVDVVDHKGAAGGRIGEKEENARVVAEQLAQVRPEVDHHERLERSRPDQFDSGRAAHRTTGTIGGDQVGSVDHIVTIG